MHFTHYQILGISPTATPQEIKAAYKRLAMQYHPDRNQGSKAAEAHFIKVNQANQVLSNPQLRARYDYSLRRPQPRAQARPAAQHYPPPQQRAGGYYYQARQSQRPPRSTSEQFFDFGKQIYQARLWMLGMLIIYLLGTGFYRIMNSYTASLRFEQGEQAEQDGQRLAAYGYYTEVLKFDKKNADAYFRKARLEDEVLGNQARAFESVDRAIELGGNQAKLSWFDLRGRMAMATGHHAQAIADMEKGLSVNRENVSYLENLGIIYATGLSQPDKALFYLDQIPEQERPTTLVALCHILLEDYDSATGILDQYLKTNADDGAAYYYRSQAFLQMGDSVKACSDLGKALQLGIAEAGPAIDVLCK